MALQSERLVESIEWYLHISTQGTYEWDHIWKKRIFVDVIKLSTLRWDCPVLFWLGPKFNDKDP